MDSPADLAFFNGTVLTLEDGPPPTALSVRDGLIHAVGEEASVRSRTSAATTIVDLDGRTLAHGFIDAHAHLIGIGVERRLRLDLADAASLDDVLQRLETAARATEEDAWILGRGWDESRWALARYPTRADLDRVTTQHHVALYRVDGHMACLNSKAMSAIDLPADPTLVDHDNGHVRETALGALHGLRSAPPDEVTHALQDEIAHANSLGITGVHDTCGFDALATFAALRDLGRLNARVRVNVPHRELGRLSGPDVPVFDDLLSRGAIKIIADGSIGARNAAFTLPYTDEPTTRGHLNHAPTELAPIIRAARDASAQIEVHAIGDAAIGAALDALREAGIGPDDRARIEHCELPSDAHLDHMRTMGVVASMQPNFLQWSGRDGLYERRLGPERDARTDPHRRVLDAGVHLAFGSDHMPLGPLSGIHRAVNAPHPGQRISVTEALRAHTAGGAYAGFSDGSSGRLRPGYRADLVVLDANPIENARSIDRIVVERTYVGGRVVFERK